MELESPCTNTATALNSSGYGQLTVRGKTNGHHRFMYCAANNVKLEDISGLVVRHLCHNRACINPLHLKLGTQAENVKDMIDAGRGGFGAKPKLTAEAVREIRQSKLTHYQAAAKFNVGYGTISKVRNKRSPYNFE